MWKIIFSIYNKQNKQIVYNISDLLHVLLNIQENYLSTADIIFKNMYFFIPLIN